MQTTVDTPQVTSVQQNGLIVNIQGNGFSNHLESNIISVGETGSCTVQSATSTTIVCSLINAPSGEQILQVNIADKGLASSNAIYTVNVPLLINSFVPNGGDSGGGYPLIINGGGFSSNTVVKLGENYCINTTVINLTTIECVVPPSTSGTSNQVRITVYDGLNSTTSSTQYTYNSTILPTIQSINPTYLTMTGGLVEINGTGFGTNDISVIVDNNNVRVISSSNTRIVVSLGALSAGLHPIRVRTSTSFAKPLFHIEYRFYIQQIYPQVGSAYGGNDLFINGVGFENGTRVQLRNKDNRTSPCNIVSVQSNQIHCQTTLNPRQITITSYGTHTTYGFGYSWYPSRETIQQGTKVTWHWDSDQLSSPAYYRVQQVDNAYGTTPTSNGFDSGTPTSSGNSLILFVSKIYLIDIYIGSFSYQFDTLGTFYYWSPNVQQSSGYSMRGVIDVVPLDDEIMNVEVLWEKFYGKFSINQYLFV